MSGRKMENRKKKKKRREAEIQTTGKQKNTKGKDK